MVEPRIRKVNTELFICGHEKDRIILPLHVVNKLSKVIRYLCSIRAIFAYLVVNI